MQFERNKITIIFFLIIITITLGSQGKVVVEDDSSSIIVTPEEYGAIGDGINDDTLALQKAMDSLGESGGTVYLKSGNTYRITDTIDAESNIVLSSTNTTIKAKIFLDSTDKNKPVLHFSGKIKYTTFIKNKGISYNENILTLQNTDSINQNDLLLIESNKLWYYDPRPGNGALHKGELHRVQGIKSNSEVHLEHPVWDDYAKNENIKITIIKPIKTTIKGIEIDRLKTTENTVGVKLTYCTDCSVSDVTVNNATNIGIFIVSNYGTTVENSNIKGANYSRTGYGIQTYGSSFSVIRDNIISGSRRGIDVSGSYPDNNSIVEYNTVYGGGHNVLNEEYIIEEKQYGIGTHSTANNTTFRGNTLINFNYGINIRSQNVVISQNRFLGYYKNAAILLAYGTNALIDDNRVIPNNRSKYLGVNYTENEEFPDQVQSFIHILRSYEYDKGHIIINNNYISNLTREFIRFSDQFSTENSLINHLEINGNYIEYSTTYNTKQYFINSNYPVESLNGSHSGNTIIKPSNYIAYNNFQFINN
jgi:hypothetical protein